MLYLTKTHRYALSILSGILLVVSFPYTGSLTPFVFVAWIPLLLVENYISLKRYRSSKVFLHAYLVFLVYNIGTTWWIWNASPEGAVMAFTLNSLLMSLVFYLFHLTKKYIGKKEGYLSLLFYWISFEYLHFHWELSWPWLNLGNTFSIHPYAVQWYAYTGILGGTLWILVVNLIGFRIVENRFLKREKWVIQTPLVYLFVLAIFVPFLLSLYQYSSYTEKEKPLEVVVLQPNIDPYNEKFSTSEEEQLEKMYSLGKRLVRPSTAFVLAPETAISYPFYEEEIAFSRFYPYLIRQQERWGNPSFLIGASTLRHFNEKQSIASRAYQDGPGYYESYNTTLLLAPHVAPEFLHKSKLVLGVEKMPFTKLLPFLERLSIDKGGTSGTLGIEKEPKVLRAENTTIAPIICYESVYGGFIAEQCRKGAEVLFVITNDGWWGDTPGYKQHASFSRLRAVENRRSVCRSANTGISCFINQRGDIVQRTGWWEAKALRGNVNRHIEKSFYTIYGDVLGRSFTFVSALLLLLTFVRGFKKRYSIG